jgi:hypothetical protein
MIERIIPFVREGSRGVETIAIVKCKVHPAQIKVSTTIEALKEVITSWIKGFDEGKREWERSGEDFNIGDLALCDQTFLEREKDRLAHYGIHDFEIVCVVDHSECIPYDTVLVNTEELD